MKQREKRNIVIGLLCVMVVFMSVGYAVLSQNLNINGTANITGSWDIYIESITFNTTESSATTSGTGSVDASDKTKASYQANLLKPQDEVVYDVVVANNGTIDAVLNDITLTPEDNEYFKFETIGIEKGEELVAKTGDTPTTKEFKIKITFKDSVTEANMPDAGTEVDGLVKLDYVQEGAKFETGGIPGDDVIIPAEEPDFLVTSDGVLLSYRGTNTEVVVPAEVNGIKIKAIAPYAFNKSDFILLTLADGIQKAVITNDTKAETIRTLGEEYGIEEYPRENVYTKLKFSDLFFDDKLIDAIDSMLITDSGIIGVKDTKTTHLFQHITALDLSEMLYLEEIMYSAMRSESLNSEGEIYASGTLTSLSLPMDGALTTIGDGAFRYNQLTTIEFPESLTKIGVGAFRYNQLTGNITIPSSVTTIGEESFQNNNLTSATVLGDKTRFDSEWSGKINSIFDESVIRLPE